MVERTIYLDGHDAGFSHWMMVYGKGHYLNIEYFKGHGGSYFEMTEDQARALRDTINEWLERR